MLKRMMTALWGKFESREEVQKFSLLAFIFGLIIGVYWAMRPIKDSVFAAIVGGDQLWLAKILSLCIIFPLVIAYSKLIDTFPRQRVFYGLTLVYAVLMFGFAWAFMHPTIGLENTISDPSRWLGWAWYVYVESFGSLIVALFWAITTDITTPDAAKRGFPVLALMGQIGNIVGPFLLNAKTLGFKHSGPVLLILGALIALICVLFWFFMHVTPASQLVGYESKAKDKEDKKEAASEPGFFEGLKLILTNGYLLGMFTIITVYEVIVTVLDYHFKQTVFAEFAVESEAASFLSKYASSVGVVATICVLLGINNIQRKLGMKASLLLLPALVMTAVVTLYFYPTALNVAFWIMVFSKAINYALNQPTMKMLYIPTSHETKYKSQAWIEMFGSRVSKAMGSGFNGIRSVIGLMPFMTITLFASSGLVACWVFIALYVARLYNKAIKDNSVVC